MLDVTLPSSLTVVPCDGDTIKETMSIPEIQVSNEQSLIPSHFNQIYHELSIIHQKLQVKKSTVSDKF